MRRTMSKEISSEFFTNAMMYHCFQTRNKYSTLAELLIVLTIISILIIFDSIKFKFYLDKIVLYDFYLLSFF